MPERIEAPNPSLFPIDYAIACPILESWLESMRASDKEKFEEASDTMETTNGTLFNWVNHEHKSDLVGLKTTENISALTFFTNLTLHEVLVQTARRTKKKVPRVELEDLQRAISLIAGSDNGEIPTTRYSDEVIAYKVGLEWEKIMLEDDFMRFFSTRMVSHLPQPQTSDSRDLKKIADRKKLSMVIAYRSLQFASQPKQGKK